MSGKVLGRSTKLEDAIEELEMVKPGYTHGTVLRITTLIFMPRRRETFVCHLHLHSGYYTWLLGAASVHKTLQVLLLQSHVLEIPFLRPTTKHWGPIAGAAPGFCCFQP